MSNDFILRFIEQLRAPELESSPLIGKCALRLADHLEWRVAQARNDGFDIACIGHDDHDRECLAEWLDKAAHWPAMLAPSWTRTFSEAVAWLLRHNLGVNEKSVLLAQVAVRNATLVKAIDERGILEVWDSLDEYLPR